MVGITYCRYICRSFCFFIVKAVLYTGTWISIATVWGILGAMLSYLGWGYAQRHVLKETKEHAVIILRTTKTERHWRNGHPVTDYIFVLIFEFQVDKQLTIESQNRMFSKLYNALRCGDSGTLIYKKGKRNIYFIDFVRD